LKIQRYRQAVYKISAFNKWHIISDKELESGEGPYGDDASLWDHVICEYQKNPLAYFLPHGVANPDGTNDGINFINDWEHDIQLVIAPSKVGKSYVGGAKAAFFGGDCDPDWMCFKEHGIVKRDWPGNTEGIISSFSWDNVAILWGNYIKLFPREWLGQWAPNWGTFPGEHGRQFSLSFGDGKRKEVKLPCGMKVTMLCDSQQEIHWESRQADWGHADEQLSENKFDILLGRFQTSQLDYNPTWCTLTPFVIDDRPDTGASGWMKKKLADAKVAKGRTISSYVIDMDCVPTAIVSEKKKKKAFEMNITEPKRLNDDLKIREGRARYFAEWQAGGGIILSAWNTEIHWIEPFDMSKFNPTYYRMMDYGENPMAVLLFAVMPWGDIVVYDEFYTPKLSHAENCRIIVEELCGNKRHLIDTHEFEGHQWDVYEEQMTSVEFYASEMDSRSYGRDMKESGRLLGQLYNDYGFYCTRADGRKNDEVVPLLMQAFDLDKTREHINKHLGRPIPRQCAEGMGAPTMYVVDCCKNFRAEIEGWIRNPKTGKAIDKDDHLISCAKFFTARERPYMGNYWITRGGENHGSSNGKAKNSETGY
jgi:hypothetical protein